MKLLNVFLNALYPEGVACLLCNRNARLDRRGLCEKCRESIDPAAEIHIDGVISGAVAAMAYNDAAAQLIHGFKYGNRRYMGRGLAGGIDLPGNWNIDAAVPVPLHPKREKERGYNQSMILAEELGRRYDIPAKAFETHKIYGNAVHDCREGQARKRPGRLPGEGMQGQKYIAGGRRHNHRQHDGGMRNCAEKRRRG